MATSPPPATRSPAPPERAGRTPGSIVRRSRAAHDRDPAEVVVVGEITGATGFEKSTRGGSVLCKWAVVHGERWTLTRGDKSGATQAAKACWAGGELATWAHPIQLSFKTTSAQARPRVASRRVASVARRPVDRRTRANRANGLLLFRCQRRSSSLPPSLPRPRSLTSSFDAPASRRRRAQGWPKLVFAVYERDAWSGVDVFAAYGIKVRSVHWSPYDRVGVVNADP